MKRIVAALLLFAVAAGAQAQIAVGTWVMREHPQMTMIVSAAGAGYDVTYHFATADGKSVTMTLTTALDGSETPFLIDGKPSGQTYIGTRIDSHHVVGIMKMDGRQSGSMKSELSADGNTITVENDSSAIGGGKKVEHWDRR
jgi:hypothetical protein